MLANEPASNDRRPLTVQTRQAVLCSSLASCVGITDTVTCVSWARRNVICVANLVQRPLSRGNGSFVKASRTELLPLDWSPTTTSCGRSTCSPTLHAKSLSIFSRRSGLASPKCEPSPSMIAGLVTDTRWIAR